MDKGHTKERWGDGAVSRTPSGPGGGEDQGRTQKQAWGGDSAGFGEGHNFQALVQVFSRLHRARGEAQADLAERSWRVEELARQNSDLKRVLKTSNDSLHYCRHLAKCKAAIVPARRAPGQCRQLLAVVVAAAAATMMMLGGLHEGSPLSLEESAALAFAGAGRLAGESSLNVCSRGIGPQWMYKDGEFLCPLGSLWLDHDDDRFFGVSPDSCVAKKQWDGCRSPLWGWPSFKGMHNTCWDMVFGGAGRDEATGIISWEAESACFASIRRRSSVIPCTMGTDGSCVARTGVSAADAEAARARLHVSGLPAAGHAFPASVERLLGARVALEPLEEAPAPRGAAQAVSQLSVVVVDKVGVEHELVKWLQWEGAVAAPALVEA